MNVSILLMLLCNIAIAEDAPEEKDDSEKSEDAPEAEDGETPESNAKNIRIRPAEEERQVFDGVRLRAKTGIGRYGFLQNEKKDNTYQELPVDSSFLATTVPLDFDVEVLVKDMVTIDASMGWSPYRLSVAGENSLRQISGYSIGAKYRHPISDGIFVEGGLSYGSIGTFAFIYDNAFSEVDLDRTVEKGVALRTAAITSVKSVDLRLSFEEYFSPLPTNTKLVLMGDYALQPVEIPMLDSELLLSAALELDWHHFPYTRYDETVAIRGFQRNLLLGAGILW